MSRGQKREKGEGTAAKSSCCDHTEASRKKAKTYHFHPEWEEEFIFTLVKEKCVCMLCHQTQALSKRGNLERHHNTNHPKFKDSYPPKSAIRAKKNEELKTGLKAQQRCFTKPAVQSKAATEASLRVSHLLAKHKSLSQMESYLEKLGYHRRNCFQ